ncbi:hypothetical protein BKA81DRAFT_373730 [Phyllosticta paracitricarpa]
MYAISPYAKHNLPKHSKKRKQKSLFPSPKTLIALLSAPTSALGSSTLRSQPTEPGCADRWFLWSCRSFS